MNVETRNFGTIEVNDDDVLYFDEGLPGFPGDRRFVLLTEGENPICYLQSVDNGDVAFVVADLVSIMPNYSPQVAEEHLGNIGECDDEDLLVLNICTVSTTMEDSTVNLKAPIVINVAAKKGKQVICSNEEYMINAPLFGDDDAEEGLQC